jgi:hypothetical protein
MVKQRGGDMTTGIMTFFIMLLFSAALGAGIYFYLNSQLPHQAASGSGKHPGPRPPKPDPQPDPSPSPHPGPSPPSVDPNDFTGTLKLIAATYTAVGKTIAVDYVINGSNLLPKGVYYMAIFSPKLNGGPLSPAPGFLSPDESEPITEDQIGLHHTTILETSGVDPNADLTQLTVTGQIKYSGMINGQLKKGTIGSPMTIKVSGV